MTRTEARNQKRKEVVEAIVLRKEPDTLVARVYNTVMVKFFCSNFKPVLALLRFVESKTI